MDAALDILCANLDALARADPALAQRLRDQAPADLAWSASRAGPLTAAIDHAGKPLALASRYDPAAEADRLVGGIDYGKTACVVLLGAGLGYHVARVAQRLGKGGVLVVFEPDAALLRAALERIDHSSWLGRRNVVLVGDTIDRGGLVGRLERFAGIMTQGMELVSHPPTRARHGEALARFSKMMTEMLAYCRTNVATTLVNSTRTCFNLASNLAHYAAGATTDDLRGAAEGFPAVCVGAGPSLVKNVDLLRDPQVRRRVIVITAQTTLKPLLDRGIRPDFVTALDWSPISARFYEDLPDKLGDVTLVVEPKVHPAVLDSFPGPIRCTRDAFNDRVLGEMATPRIAMRAGATVAHLSLYLAQHLGCDPIIQIGQDLGFSDGLYYVPGTAAHQVWSGELNAFNTLEMMEWQRIARHKAHLQRLEDADGQPIFSDEQMVTYLKQFERDFAAAAEAGRTIIDATEGGVPKDHVVRMTLADALAEHATRPAPPLPAAGAGLDADRLRGLSALLTRRVREVTELRRASRQTTQVLHQMREHQRDRQRMQKLLAQMDKQRHRVEHELAEAFSLVNSLNTIGAFKRLRSDRAIAGGASGPFERQRQQIQRDLENLNWLIQACDETLTIFDQARARAIAKLEAARRDSAQIAA